MEKVADDFGGVKRHWTRCTRLCGRVIEGEENCDAQCVLRMGHEDNHAFDCQHTLPPLPPTRPPPSSDEEEKKEKKDFGHFSYPSRSEWSYQNRSESD